MASTDRYTLPQKAWDLLTMWTWGVSGYLFPALPDEMWMGLVAALLVWGGWALWTLAPW